MNEKQQPGQVSVNLETSNPKASNLPYPAHRVLGVLSSPDAAQRAIDGLKQAGVSEEDIELFQGEAGEAWLHNYHNRTGLLGRLRQFIDSLGADQRHSEEYELALGQGHAVLAVKAADENAIESIRRALAQEGASQLRYYGVLAIRDLD